MRWQFPTTELQLAARASVGAGLSIAIANLLDLQYPIYAFIAAVIVTDLTPTQTQRLGSRRMAATAIGAICGAVLCTVLTPDPLGIGLSVLAAMLASHMLRVGDGARVAGYICGIVVLDHSTEPWAYATMRFAETAVGVATAWAISYVPKLIRADSSDAGGT